MSNAPDTRILEMLASKICHDLVSPVGAISNGIELMEELGPDGFEDASDLIGSSATKASARLKAYRIAYGAGGADSHIKPEDVHAAIADMIADDGRITQNWDPHALLAKEGDTDELPKAYSKILICAILLAKDSLPKGGEVSVERAGESTIVRANGDGAAVREYTAEALSHLLPISDIEPKYIHAYMTGLLAKSYGYEISIEDESADCAAVSFKRS